MRRTKFTEEQIVAVLKEFMAGVQRADICRQYGISQATFYRWKSRFGAPPIVDTQQKLRMLEDENNWLKKIVGDLTLSNVVLKNLLSKKL